MISRTIYTTRERKCGQDPGGGSCECRSTHTEENPHECLNHKQLKCVLNRAFEGQTIYIFDS